MPATFVMTVMAIILVSLAFGAALFLYARRKANPAIFDNEIEATPQAQKPVIKEAAPETPGPMGADPVKTVPPYTAPVTSGPDSAGPGEGETLDPVSRRLQGIRARANADALAGTGDRA